MSKLKILQEDNHIIVVEKPRGLLTQGDSTGSPTLIDKVKDYIKTKYNKPGNVFLGMVQRLDKPVSGLLVFARTSKAAKRLNEEFRKRKVVKMYLAVVQGEIKIGHDNWHQLKHYISMNDGYVNIHEDEGNDSKPAVLKLRKILSNSEGSLLLIKLETGLKHQIRVQLSQIGHPIIGDKKYGSNIQLGDGSILLHSYYLEFSHPTTQEKIHLTSKIPVRFLQTIQINYDVEKTIKDIINTHK